MLARFRENALFETIFFAGYFALKKITCKETCANRKNEYILENVIDAPIKEKPLKEYHIAIVCDELTYVNFSKECHLYVLTPNNWRNVFAEHTIDLFLCESAWNGCDIHNQCWRGRVYKNHNVLFETRKTLFQILAYCKENNIPTVFWNKEDPTYFGNRRYDFVDTAMQFQYIFTTDAECVERYKAKGHKNVFVMTFGFSPQIYNPKFEDEKQWRAIFAGSWYAEEKQRCSDEEQIFRKILSENIPLVIFNRHSASNRTDRQYPEEFRPYVHDAISQEILSREIKRSSYAININTETQSKTMLARRVYELMASNIYIISNDARAMRINFDGRYSTANDEIPINYEKICRENVDYVFRYHTNKARIETMLQQIGLPVRVEQTKIAICSENISDQLADKKQNYAVTFVKDLSDITAQYQYFVLWDGVAAIDIPKMLPHFDYLDGQCGVRVNEQNLYHIVEDNDNENVLFPITLLKYLQTNTDIVLQKYHV